MGTEYTNTGRQYKQLSLAEREKIEAFYSLKFSISEIARLMKQSKLAVTALDIRHLLLSLPKTSPKAVKVITAKNANFFFINFSHSLNLYLLYMIAFFVC